jgi:hypothetical protein
MIYTTFAVQNDPDIVEAAKLISRSLDLDVGGYYAYSTIATDKDDKEFAVYGAFLHDEFAEKVPFLKDHPEALLKMVNTDIAERWNGEPVFTLAQCKLFTDSVLISYQFGIHAGMDELGLVLKQSVSTNIN